MDGSGPIDEDDVEEFSLTDKQLDLRDMAAGPEVHNLAYGGSRSGKTFGFTYCIATRAIMAPKSRHLISRLHNIDVRQSVMMDTWPSMMQKAYPQVYDPRALNKSDQYYTFPNGAEVWFGGLDDKERVDKILGKEYATIYVNEASQVAYDTILTLRTRLAQNVRKSNKRTMKLKAYYDLNPTGRGHWTYREFVEGLRIENDLPVPPGSRRFIVMNPEDNPHLSQTYLDELDSLPERQRQRFRKGEYLLEVPGSLWPLDVIEASRIGAFPDLVRIVVAIDPSGSDGIGGDQQGIVIVGLGADGHCYVLEDASCRLSPAGWAGRAVSKYEDWQADRIVAEVNYGGAMVKHAVSVASQGKAAFTEVHASRGKVIRAEPVSALYEKGMVHHVGTFRELEDQMAMFTTTGYQGKSSPDRVDALVWAITFLKLSKVRRPAASAGYKRD